MYTCNNAESSFVAKRAHLSQVGPSQSTIGPQRSCYGRNGGWTGVTMFQKVTIKPSSTAFRSPLPPELSSPASNAR
jgi:hypothetical protein